MADWFEKNSPNPQAPQTQAKGDWFAKNSPTAKGAQPSLVSEALKYSPAGTVKGLADAIRADVQNPGETGSGIVQMMKSNATLWDKAKASFKAGDYTGAAAHFLNYLIPGGQALEDAGEDFQSGNTAHGVAKTAGLASNFGVPAVMEGITSPTAARVPGAIVEGVKAAAPDVAAGAAKAAAGEVLAKVPGMEWPARIAVQYPALRQVKAGMGKFGPAFKSALEEKLQAIVDNAPEAEATPPAVAAPKLLGPGPVVTPPPADPSFVRGQSVEWSPSQGKWVPKGTAADAVAAPVKPEGQTAAANPPAAPEVSQLDAIAQQGIFGKKYKSFAAAPAEAQATIRALVSGESSPVSKPVIQPLPPTAAPSNAPVTPQPTTLQEMMRGVPDEAARAEFLRQREAATSPARSIADGMYARGGQKPGEAAAAYQAAARTDKAIKLAQSLHDNGISAADLEPHQASDLVGMLKAPSDAIGVKAPSTQTIPEILFHLKRLEADVNKASIKTSRLYHGTSSELLDQIQSEGIQTRRAGASGKGTGTTGKLYLSPFPEISSDEAWNTVNGDDATETEGIGGHPVVVELDRKYIKGLEKDPEYSQGRSMDVGSLLYRHDIPPEAIVAVHKGSQAIKAAIKSSQEATKLLAKKSGRQ